MAREKFGLAELAELEAEMPKIKKGDVKTIKLILKVAQISNRLLEEARDKVASGRRKLSELNMRVKELGREMEEAGGRIEAEEDGLKRLERIMAKFA